MARMIQIRNVPDALHRSLKARAAMAGMSLSDYLLAEFREIAERPTLAEFRERLHKRKPLPVALDTGGLLREERTAMIVLDAPVLLLNRIWQLRQNLSAYDAAYVALAEELQAPLITRDQGIAAAPGHKATIEVF
jgi:predicted nucleic acid-binding protein